VGLLRFLVALAWTKICSFAKDLFIAAIGGGGHDEKGGAPAGEGWGHASRGQLAERITEEPRSSAHPALHRRVEPNAS